MAMVIETRLVQLSMIVLCSLNSNIY